MAKYPIRQYGMVKKTENLDTKAIRTLISSHAENLRRTARINEKLDNLLALIKDADSISGLCLRCNCSICSFFGILSLSF